ncbi:MAG: N-acetyl-alpha-D-glucosaminyl L-malate synthase BshA [Bacteroidia bacterium]|nr:N-acetyl-alpha-D-glucosaminyl L-malate synthase BshA [Bacteroidia bacterium]MDW8159483.1 N-acetyl-alpha-D-glucosaminyl L-malate synthase BshA [Bacteroidia bacterium]
MKVGIVCYPTFGGSGVVATELGKALGEREHIVHFITYERPVRLGRFTRNVFFHQVKAQEYPLFDFVPYESALTSKLVDVVRFENLDILHVHYAIPHASSAYFAQQILKEMGIHIPFITTLHGTDSTLVGISSAYEPVVSFSINHSNGITCVSNYLKQITIQNFQIQKPIKVIPNFIDTRRFKPLDSTVHNKNCLAPQGERILMHVSNFRKVKRVKDVVEVFRILEPELPLRLVFVGDGPERDQVESLVRKYQLNTKVSFLGNQESVEDLLPLGDIFILPSENESFGLAVLEAMACGLPVVCTATGGLPEVVSHGLSGFLSPLGDVEDMAKNIRIILASEDTYQQFSLNARKEAQRFTLEYILPQYENYYEEVLLHFHEEPHQQSSQLAKLS